MKIFLDDIRLPEECVNYMHTRIGKLNPIYNEEWIIVRNYKNFCNQLNRHFKEITHISFDHDLGDIIYDPSRGMEIVTMYEKSGYDCAKYTKDLYEKSDLKLPIMFVHSCNPVGTQNIINLFK
jgi:hypothetical protein